MEYFLNMDVNKVNDNKTMKPRFSNKCKTANNEGNMIIKKKKLMEDTFSNYFADIVKTLK